MKYGLVLFRTQNKLTQKEMANKLNISRSFYEKVELGIKNPSYNFILKLKGAFPTIDINEVFFTERDYSYYLKSGL